MDRDRSFIVPAGSFGLAAAVLFAYIAGSSFVLEDIHGVSPQGFSLVFAVNSAGLVGMSRLSGRLVSRFGAAALLRYALGGVALGSVATLVVTLAHAGLVPLLVSLFVILSSTGWSSPTPPLSPWPTRRARSAAHRRCWGSASSAPGR